MNEILDKKVDGTLFKTAYLENKEMSFYFDKYKLSHEVVSPFFKVSPLDIFDYDQEIENLKK
jgi:hypothetical protein